MYTTRHVTGDTIEEMLNPPLRSIQYGGHPAVNTVSTRLRQAWALRPELAGDVANFSAARVTNEAIKEMIHNLHVALNEGEMEAMRNPDKDTAHTPLRDALYYMWNHVFYDVSRFLSEVNCGTGIFQPPAEEVQPIEYPECEGNWADGILARVQELEFDTHVLVSPMFVDPGVKIKVLVGAESNPTITDNESHDGDPSSFEIDATETEGIWNKPEIWWVKAGQRIQIYLGGNFDKSRCGLAAVFVIGKYTVE